MSKFTLSIDCGNAAFDGDPRQEVARILRNIAAKLEDGHADGNCIDYNGNKVGQFKITGLTRRMKGNE